MKVYFYHAGYDFFEKELDTVFSVLRNNGVEIIKTHDINTIIAVKSGVIVSNVPTNEYWKEIKSNEKKIVHISRSKDSTYAPHWVNQYADVFCAANTIEERALVNLLGRDRVVPTGMPYFDKYFNITTEQMDTVERAVDGDYILGIQVSFDAHGVTFTHPMSFLKDFYETGAKRVGRVLFRRHINHVWEDRHITNPIDLPVEYTPALVTASSGMYASHFSFMLMEAAFCNKKIYIYPENPEWNKVAISGVTGGWWCNYDWKSLGDDKKNKELGDAYRAYNDGNAGKRVADIIMKYL